MMRSPRRLATLPITPIALLLALTACTPISSPSATSKEPEPVQATASATPLAKAPPTLATVVPTAKPAPVPCKIFPIEICGTAEFIKFAGTGNLAVALRLPSGTPVFAPSAGFLSYAVSGPPEGRPDEAVASIALYEDECREKRTLSIRGSFNKVPNSNLMERRVSQGEQIAVSNGGDPWFVSVPSYDLLVSPPGGTSHDEQAAILSMFFPNATAIPARQVELVSSRPSGGFRFLCPGQDPQGTLVPGTQPR